MARGKSDKGQYIDHTYMEGAIHLITWFTHRFFQDGTVMKRGESWAMGTYPHYGVYKTSDGKYLSIGCLEPHFWDNLCKAIGKEEFMPAKWTMDMTYRAPDEKLNAIRSSLEQVFLTKTRDEWFDLLSPQDIPVGKVYDIGEVFERPPGDPPEDGHRAGAPETGQGEAGGDSAEALGNAGPGQKVCPGPRRAARTRSCLPSV